MLSSTNLGVGAAIDIMGGTGDMAISSEVAYVNYYGRPSASIGRPILNGFNINLTARCMYVRCNV